MPALQKEMAIHSSILDWRLPGTEEPGGLPSVGLHRVRHNWRDLAAEAVHEFESENISLQSCLTLCDSMDCSRPGSSVNGILQAGILEWVALSFSRGSSWPRDQTRVSCIVGRFFTIWGTRENPHEFEAPIKHPSEDVNGQLNYRDLGTQNNLGWR